MIERKQSVRYTMICQINLAEWNKANLRDLMDATRLEILFKIGFKSSIFRPLWPWNLMDDLK